MKKLAEKERQLRRGNKQDDEINKLLKAIKMKAIVFEMTMVSTVVTALLVQSSGMVFMFYKEPPSAAYALYFVS